MKRRQFIQNTTLATTAVGLVGLKSCMTKPYKSDIKISLAQWSLHKAILNEKSLNPLDFALKAREIGFEAIEYVSGLYASELEKNSSLSASMILLSNTLKTRSEDAGIKNLLIMVDGEGALSSPDDAVRDQAVENHKKWVDMAAELGCHSIRVNLFGEKEQEAWIAQSASGLSQLASYAAPSNINVLVENHGGFSSNAALLVEVMKQVNMDNCGTLPDFGNFCIRRETYENDWGSGACVEKYDNYQGVHEMMPYAKAVSAKSYDFDAAGNEVDLDYKRILQLVKDSGYNGYIGVEYEGSRLGEYEGIEATRKLLQSVANEIKF